MCLLFQQSEIYLIEYGKSEVLGPCRTDYQALHLLSFQLDGMHGAKFAAYLSDANTISIANLANGYVLANMSHERTVDWLEVFSFSFCEVLLIR